MATPVRTIWQGFVRGSLGTGVAIVARAAGALTLNKLVALYGGLGGLTQLAQFQNLMALFGALPTDGVQVGATTRLAPLRPGSGRHRAWLGAALLLTGLVVAGAGAVLLATGGAAWPASQAALFTVAMLLVTSQALLSTALLAAGRRGPYVAQAVAISVLGTAAAAATLAAGWPLRQVLLAYVGGQALTLPLAGWAAQRAGLLGSWRWRPSAVAGRGLLPFLLMAAGSLVCGRAIDYGLRTWLIAHYPPARTDLWQAVAKLSDNYTLVVGALLNTVLYPRLAALTATPAQARRYLEAVLGLLAVGLAGALGLVYALRDVLLPLLFAPRLLAARELLAPQLLGDWAKFMSWVFLYYLLARARPLPYLAMQAVGAVLYVAALLALVPRYGLSGVVWAYALYYAVLLGLCAVLYKWQWK